MFRRGSTIIALAAALAAGASAAAAADPAMLEAARKEGKVTVYGSWPAAPMKAFSTAFTARTGVAVEFTNMATSQIIQRFLTELEANQPQVDVVQISDLAPFLEFSRRDLLMPFDSPEYRAFPAQYRDAQGRWVVLALNAEVLVYNTERVAKDKAPKGWQDILRPEFRGAISAPDIKGGGTGYLYYYAMRKLYGPEFHQALGALKPQLHVATAAQGQAVMSGEASIAVGLLHYTATTALLADPKSPIAVVWAEPIPLAVRAAGISRRAPRPNAAKLLMDYFASVEGQKVSVTDVGSISPRPDAPTQGVPDLAGRKTFVVGPDDMDEYLRSEKPFNDEFARAYTR